MNSSLSSSQIATPETPWLGLRSFTEDAHDYFFGRQAELEDLYGRIVDKPLTIFFGQSGLGKSSLIQAALIPSLRRQGFLPVRIRIDHEPNAPAPEEQILHELQHALYGEGFASQADMICEGLADPAFDAAAFLWLLFHDPAFGFLTGVASPAPRPVFLIDQFEEIFTLGERPMRRPVSHDFREALAALVENRPPSALRARLESDEELSERINYRARTARVLLSLREDFLHVLERWRQFMPSLMENRLELRMLNGTQALEAVVRPGQLRDGLPAIVPDEVGHAIVRFVAGVELDVPLAEIDAVPPLLSLVCAELNSQRLAAGETQVSRAQFEGHSDEILQSFYRRSFDPASYGGAFAEVHDVEFALQSLQRLIEEKLLSPDGFRESIAFDTIARELSRAVAPDTARHLLTEIVERRLLTVEERGGVRRLELAHDVLAPIVRASRDERQEGEALAHAKREQERAKEEARVALDQRNRLRRLVFVTSCLALVAVIGAILGWLGLKRAQDARNEAVEATYRAEEASKLAETNFTEARKTVDEFVLEMGKEDLKDVPGFQSLRQKFAEGAVERYQQFASRRPDDLAVQAGLAQAKLTLSEILGDIGSIEQADKLAEDGIRLLQANLAATDSPAARIQLGVALTARADIRWSIGDQAGALPFVDAAIKELSLVTKKVPQNLDAKYELARAHNLRGNCLRESSGEDGDPDYLEAKKIILEIVDHYSKKTEAYATISAATHNLHFKPKSEGRNLVALALLEESGKYDRMILAETPNAPEAVSNHGLTLINKAKLLKMMAKHEEADAVYKEAIIEGQRAVNDNPKVSRFQWLLADALKARAQFLSSRGKFEDAEKEYLESCTMLEGLVASVEDRPQYAAALIENRIALHHYYRGSKEGKKDLAAAQAQLKEAIETTKKAVERFPKDTNLCYQFALAHNQLGSIESDQSKDTLALPWFRQAIDLYKTHCLRTGTLQDSFQQADVLSWLESAKESAKKLNYEDEILRLANEALEIGKECPTNAGKQALSGILNARADVQKKRGKIKDSISDYEMSLKITRPAWEKAKWHWYLHQSVAGAYYQLSELYQKEGNLDDEVRARQEWLRIWGGPLQSYPTEGVIDPDPAPSKELAEKLRTIMAVKKGMKRFTVPADFDGVKHPFHVYFMDVLWPKDPLEDQARWLKEERGGIIPEEVRESFRKLHKIAHENKVSFMDLCVYALSTAAEEDKKKEAAKTGKPAQAVTPETPESRFQSALEAIKQLEDAHSKDASADIKLKLSNACVAASDAGLHVKRWADSERFARRAIELAPDSPPAHGNLATALLFQGKREEALRIYKAHWDDPLNGESLGSTTYADFEALSKEGITHSDTAWIKKSLPEPKTVILPPPAKEPRKVMIFTGKNIAGNPIWSYWAIKPEFADAVSELDKANKLDWSKMSQYGELIAARLGTAPSDDIIVEVAKLYKMDLKEARVAVERATKK